MKKSIVASATALIIGLGGYCLFAVGVFDVENISEISADFKVAQSNFLSTPSRKNEVFSDTLGKKVSVSNYDVFSKVTIAERSNSAYYLAAGNMKAGDKSKNAGLSGFNYSPLMLYQAEVAWKVKDWKQEFVYPEKQLTTIFDGTYNYTFGPDYELDYRSQLADFDLKFPDFSIPAGKTTVLQMTPLREKRNQFYHKKGITYAREGPVSERYVFVSDDWLSVLGCPPAYQSSQQEFDAWLARTPARKILRSFQSRMLPLKDHGYIMLNWEAVAQRLDGPHREKLTACLRWFDQQNFHAKLNAWNESPIKISRVQLESDSSPADFAGAISFAGNLSDFSDRYNRRIQRFSEDHSELLDVLHVGGYMNFPTNFSTIHHYMLEYLLNKKYFPEKQILATIWTNQELVGDFPLTRRDYKNYYCFIKPAVFPQTMFNWGVWSVAVGDGFDCWYDPWYVTNDISQNGFNCFDSRNNSLPLALPAQYPHSPLKNVDDLMAGTWAVSQHKDIIESKSNWRFTLTPDESFFSRKPMVAYKFKNPSLTLPNGGEGTAYEALILVYDAFSGEIIADHQITVQLPDGTNRAIKVKTFGTRTSVVRVGF